MKIHIVVFQVVTCHSVADNYQHFSKSYGMCLQEMSSTLKMEVQQNSVNLTYVGPDRCPITEYFRLSDDTHMDLNS